MGSISRGSGQHGPLDDDDELDELLLELSPLRFIHQYPTGMAQHFQYRPLLAPFLGGGLPLCQQLLISKHIKADWNCMDNCEPVAPVLRDSLPDTLVVLALALFSDSPAYLASASKG